MWVAERLQQAKDAVANYKHALKEKRLESFGESNQVDPHIYQYMDGHWERLYQCMKCLTIMTTGMAMKTSCYHCWQHPNRTLIIEARWFGKKPKVFYTYPGRWETRTYIEPQSFVSREKVPSTAPPLTGIELEQAYRLLKKKAHPDTGGSNEAFRFIQWAYEQAKGT